MTRCKYAKHFEDITCYNKAIGYIKIRPNEELGRISGLKIPVCKFHKDLIFETNELKDKDPVTHELASCTFKIH